MRVNVVADSREGRESREGSLAPAALAAELESLGLDDKERRFYLSVLQRPMGTLAELASRSGVTRTNAYDVLEKLQRRGLVRSIAGPAGKVVVAEDPAVLLSAADRQRESLQRLLPSLRLLGRAVADTTIRLYSSEVEVAKALGAVASSALDGAFLLCHPADRGGLGLPRWIRVMGAAMASQAPMRVLASPTEAGQICPSSLPACIHLRASEAAAALEISLRVQGAHSLLVGHDALPFALAIESPSMAAFHRATFDLLWRDASLGRELHGT